MYTETIENLRAKGQISLSKITNNHGDVFYRILALTYQDGRRTCYTMIEYSSAELAQSEFHKMVGE